MTVLYYTQTTDFDFVKGLHVFTKFYLILKKCPIWQVAFLNQTFVDQMFVQQDFQLSNISSLKISSDQMFLRPNVRLSEVLEPIYKHWNHTFIRESNQIADHKEVVCQHGLLNLDFLSSFQGIGITIGSEYARMFLSEKTSGSLRIGGLAETQRQVGKDRN